MARSPEIINWRIHVLLQESNNSDSGRKHIYSRLHCAQGMHLTGAEMKQSTAARGFGGGLQLFMFSVLQLIIDRFITISRLTPNASLFIGTVMTSSGVVLV